MPARPLPSDPLFLQWNDSSGPLSAVEEKSDRGDQLPRSVVALKLPTGPIIWASAWVVILVYMEARGTDTNETRPTHAWVSRLISLHPVS